MALVRDHRAGGAALAAALFGWLAAAGPPHATRAAIVEATRARYSWEGVARTVIAAAQGDLSDLPSRLTCQAAVARAIVARADGEGADGGRERELERQQAGRR